MEKNYLDEIFRQYGRCGCSYSYDDSNDKKTVISLSIPGLEKENFSLKVEERDGYENKVIRVKHSPKWTKTIKLSDIVHPVDIAFEIKRNWDVAKAEAVYANGILEITIPLIVEEPQFIPVKFDGK